MPLSFSLGHIQAMGFQAVLAPALVLCGAVLYGSGVGLATGEIPSPRLKQYPVSGSYFWVFYQSHKMVLGT